MSSTIARSTGPPKPVEVPINVGILLWSGGIGGAETWSLSLAHALARRGLRPGLVVIGSPEPVCDEKGLAGLPCMSLFLTRGRDVMWHLRDFSRACSAAGADVMIMPSAGPLAGVLRLAGYAGKIIAMEHGRLLQARGYRWPRRPLRLYFELGGLGAVDALVTPSEFMKREVERYSHSRRVVCIRPGLDLSNYAGCQYPPVASSRGRAPTVVGFAGRLIHGKGVDVLLRAVASLGPSSEICVRVAGDGPVRPDLERMARALAIDGRVSFSGWVRDMSEFWSSCDLAVVPSNECVESFGMVAVEAMACGLPVIASRRGGLQEIVAENETGFLFEAGNWGALARLIATYAGDRNLRVAHGNAARRACIANYDIARCAYEFDTLGRTLLGAHISGGPNA